MYQRFCYSLFNFETQHKSHLLYVKSYVPGYSSGVNYRDPNIKIKWPVKINIISPKDKNLPFVK